MLLETVSVIGLGYIGLPTAAVLASRGLNVIGVDINQNVVDIINSGKIHIVEPDLEALVHEVVRTGKLQASTEPDVADAFLIAVPTPFKDNHQPDLRFVEAAVRAIAPVLKKGDLVILESTSPVGTTEQLTEWFADSRPDLLFPLKKEKVVDINIAYCPERVLPGQVVHELVINDRVIGGMTPDCAQRAVELYKTFVQGECISTNAQTAEMCKLTENSFRDVNIAFANELSIICDKLNINVWELIQLSNRHPRVNILQPGPGVGGHCIAVDPWFIVSKTPDEAKLIRTARAVNDHKPQTVIDKVQSAAIKFEKPIIACMGLSFKADIDDLRESPSVGIVEQLKKLQIGTLYLAEPHIDCLPDNLSGDNVVFASMEEAIDKADIVVLLVNHRSFDRISIGDLNGKVLIDTRGVWTGLR